MVKQTQNLIAVPKYVELKNARYHWDINRTSTQDLQNYRRFLFLLKKYPLLKAVPTKAIDRIWHFHLENTTCYRNDCMSYFGRVVIHREMKDKSEMIQQRKNYKSTNRLWLLNFEMLLGEVSDMAFCGVDGDDSGVED